MSDDGFRIPGESTEPAENPAPLSRALSGGETKYVTGAEGKRPNKSAIIFGAAVALGGVVLYGMYWRAGPSAAAAVDATAERAVQSFLKPGAGGADAMAASAREAEGIVHQFESYPGGAQVPLDELKSNPFRHAPPAGPALPQTVALREQERAAALKAVRGLSVQSILHGGGRGACLINGAFYEQGQTVDGFLVEEIRPASVVVRSGAMRFELMMRGE